MISRPEWLNFDSQSKANLFLSNRRLYNPWITNWYCDNTLTCQYPQLGRRCGYAVTCIWGPADPAFTRMTWMHVLKAVEVNRANGRPTALILKQQFPEEYANKVGAR